MARTRVSSAGLRVIDVSSQLKGTGVCQVVASGYARFLALVDYDWDGVSLDSMNRPLIIRLQDEVIRPNGVSYYASTVSGSTGGAVLPVVTIALEGQDAKLVMSARTNRLYLGVPYFSSYFV